MILWPCLHCPHKTGCVRKRETVEGVRGLGIATASLRCKDYARGLEPGRKVQFVLPILEKGEPDKSTETGIVMRRHGRKFLIWVTVGKNDESWATFNPIGLYADRLTPLDDVVALCEECDRPADMKASDACRPGTGHWDCEKCSAGDAK